MIEFMHEKQEQGAGGKVWEKARGNSYVSRALKLALKRSKPQDSRSKTLLHAFTRPSLRLRPAMSRNSRHSLASYSLLLNPLYPKHRPLRGPDP